MYRCSYSFEWNLPFGKERRVFVCLWAIRTITLRVCLYELERLAKHFKLSWIFSLKYHQLKENNTLMLKFTDPGAEEHPVVPGRPSSNTGYCGFFPRVSWWAWGRRTPTWETRPRARGVSWPSSTPSSTDDMEKVNVYSVVMYLIQNKNDIGLTVS